jgi:hypothetical protein
LEVSAAIVTVLYDYRAAVMQNSHAASGSHNVAGRMSRELPRERSSTDTLVKPSTRHTSEFAGIPVARVLHVEPSHGSDVVASAFKPSARQCSEAAGALAVLRLRERCKGR